MKGKIFNAQEVQSMISGNKTQFREVVKNNLLKSCYKIGSYDSFTGKSESEMMPCNHSWAGKRIDMICSDCWKELLAKCPYEVGQKIFCKESWNAFSGKTLGTPLGKMRLYSYPPKQGDIITYKADADLTKDFTSYLSSARMPQWASRLTLQIKEIRVDKLINITEDEVRLEGFNNKNEFLISWKKKNKSSNLEEWVWILAFQKV
jgi:hypothetical protein